MPAAMTTAQRYTVSATGLGLFMVFLDATIVNVGLPAIQADFRIGEAGLQWVVTAYSLGMAVVIMSAATVADLHGRRLVYVAGVALFTVASVVCGLAPSLEVLNVARFVQGAAAATVNVASLALVSAEFLEPKAKARAIGIWTAIAGVGTAIGPTLGGIIVEEIGWRGVFWANLPVGIVVLLLTLKHVSESRDEHPRSLDLPGQALFMIAVGTFAFAVIEGPKQGWMSPSNLALLATSLAALAAFVVCERKVRDPMMDLTLFRDRVYALAIVTVCVALFASYGMLLLTTQYLQNVRTYSPLAAGLILLPFSLAIVIGSLFAGHLVGKFGATTPIRWGLGGMMAGLAVLIAGTHLHVGVITAGLALFGIGFALCLTPTTTLAMSSVPPRRAGMASGIMSAQRAVGSTLGYAVLGSILAAWLSATLDPDLAAAVPDATERREVAAAIIDPPTPVGTLPPSDPGGRSRTPIRRREPRSWWWPTTTSCRGSEWPSGSPSSCWVPSSSRGSCGFPAVEEPPSQMPSANRRARTKCELECRAAPDAHAARLSVEFAAGGSGWL